MRLLEQLGSGTLTASAYDTAFATRVRWPGDPGRLAYSGSLAWLLKRQNPDGSFGTPLPIVKDKLLATLAAILSFDDLPAQLRDARIDDAYQRAVRFVCDHSAGWQSGPQPVAFELLMPTLLEEARQRGIVLPYDRFAAAVTQRDAKMGHVPAQLIYKVPSALLHSLEYLGAALDTEAIRRRQAANGSFGNSPSATAFYLTRTEDPRARHYLAEIYAHSPDGGIPGAAPAEVFERAGVLSNLLRAGVRLPQARPHLDSLRAALTDEGIGISREGLRPDAGDTAATLFVLHGYGEAISHTPLRPFEGTTSFYCFPLERIPSVSANGQVLQALSLCPPFDRRSEMQTKILGFLRDVRVDGDYWVDKWHSSPFYATAHAVFALTALAPDLCRAALSWLRETQRPDGSWGWYGQGTPEETAYAVQAALVADGAFGAESLVDLPRAAAYLQDAAGEPPVPLWVGKGLYAPIHVVASAVLSARILLADRPESNGGGGSPLAAG